MSAGIEKRTATRTRRRFKCKNGRFWRAQFCIETGAPYGNRTRVSAVKGRRPRPLDEGRFEAATYRGVCAVRQGTGPRRTDGRKRLLGSKRMGVNAQGVVGKTGVNAP